MFLAVIVMLALTRAEIIERFRAPAITKAGGLVQVFADCPRDMREEFQIPVASFVADICRTLEASEGMKDARFANPGIVVHVGDERTNRTDVIVRTKERDNGEKYTKIYLPAPGFSDVERLRIETVKAFYLAARGKTLDDEAAFEAMIASDPLLKAESEYAKIARWARGVESGDDEEYLKLARSVLIPGVAKPDDVLRFASRLMLYPEKFNYPFCGKFHSCPFREAIEFAAIDPRIRLAAYAKAPIMVAYGGGRGEELAAAADAYSNFLFALAKYTATKEELSQMLEDADIKLNIALEKAREYEKDNNRQYYRP